MDSKIDSLASNTQNTRIISQNSQAIKQIQKAEKVEVDSDDELPFQNESSEKQNTDFAKVKKLDDNRAFGFTKEALEKFKAPIDDEEISEDSDAAKSDEDYEDENFE